MFTEVLFDFLNDDCLRTLAPIGVYFIRDVTCVFTGFNWWSYNGFDLRTLAFPACTLFISAAMSYLDTSYSTFVIASFIIVSYLNLRYKAYLRLRKCLLSLLLILKSRLLSKLSLLTPLSSSISKGV